MSIFSRNSQSLFAKWWWTVDRVLLAMIITLFVIGGVMVATASPSVAIRVDLSEYHFFIKHIAIASFSIVIMIAISFLDTKLIWRGSAIVFIISLFLLVYVLFFGVEVKGAQRWVNIFGFSLQPSEFAKPALIVVASWFIARRKEDESFPGYKIALACYGILLMFLLLQPDMGMSVLVTASLVSVAFLGGAKFRYVAMLIAVFIVGLIISYFTFSHVQSRVDRFLNSDSGDTYQIEKSLNAFKEGGILGVGPGQGQVKLRIPDAHADFIFSVAGEEFGLIFIIILVSLYAYIVVRCLNRVMDSENMFVILSVGGLLTMFALQAFINMGSSLSILPTKGMTLPLISYGGSSLLSMSMVMGMILALTRKQSRRGVSQGGLFIKSIGGEKL